MGDGGAFRLSAIIPPTARARIYLPARPEQDIREGGGQPAFDVARTDHEAIVDVGAGRFDFAAG